MSQSILNMYSDICYYPPEECVNISLKSDDLLGKYLHPKHPYSLKHPLGKFGSVNTFMDYISIPKYPTKYLKMPKVPIRELEKILSNRISVPNFYALVAWAVVVKIQNDPQLLEMLKENTKEFTSYYYKTIEIEGKKELVPVLDHRMGRYVAIIRILSKDIKLGIELDNKYVSEFISKCKDKPEAQLLEGVAFGPGPYNKKGIIC